MPTDNNAERIRRSKEEYREDLENQIREKHLLREQQHLKEEETARQRVWRSSMFYGC